MKSTHAHKKTFLPTNPGGGFALWCVCYYSNCHHYIRYVW